MCGKGRPEGGSVDKAGRIRRAVQNDVYLQSSGNVKLSLSKPYKQKKMNKIGSETLCSGGQSEATGRGYSAI